MDKQKSIIVIGAGASGFMAAITAARAGAKVTLLEHKNFTAKKIEQTGNGRCNLTNSNQSISFYNTNDTDNIKNIHKIEKALQRFSYKDTIKFFEEIGLAVHEREGYYYPLSNQACAVSQILRMEAGHLKIKIACNIQIRKITKEKELFKIYTEGYMYECHALIVAAGSSAAPHTGSDGSGYDIARAFGHKIDGPYPALVALKCSGKKVNILSGLRNYGKVRLIIDKEEIAEEVGEIQFIKSGISGIPVFQLSRYASIALNSIDKKSRPDVKAIIDFLPMFNDNEFYKFLERRIENNYFKNLSGFLTGLLHEKVISVVVAKTGVKGDLSVDKLTKKQWKNVCDTIKSMEFNIESTGDFANAQVCCGGIILDEVTENLESKMVENLYFAGEILDVDARCGGYNLQWAWSSGFTAGRSAAG